MFRERFEKRFDLKADPHIDVYLGNRIIHTRIMSRIDSRALKLLIKSTIRSHVSRNSLLLIVMVLMKPITSRLPEKCQPESVNAADQDLFREMVGSLLYLATKLAT